ncbi:putative Membrane protein [Microbacterium sp. C448]|nr:putative Membrane protein [Microbacterium sp. C448]
MVTDNSADSGKSAESGKPGKPAKKPRTPPTTSRMILWVVGGAVGIYWLGSGIIGLMSGGS